MNYGFRLAIMMLALTICTDVCLATETGSETKKAEWPSAAASRDWNMQLSIGHLPSAGLQSSSADAGITDYRIRILHDMKMNSDLTFSLGGGYALKHIDAPSRAALPDDLHGLFLELGARYRINDRAFASLKLSPGFYSDFKELGSDDLRMPLLALGGYNFENGFTVVGGFIYRLGYHSSSFFPALGFTYQPNTDWRFDLIAPRPSVTYRASRQVQLFAAGDFASEEYELHDRSSGAKAIKYGDYKVMAGLTYLPSPAVRISTSLGYAFERKFSFYDSARPDLRIDDVPFFKVSLDWGW